MLEIFTMCHSSSASAYQQVFFHFVIQNTIFTNLSNPSAFCYYTIANSNYEDATMRSVLIKNVTGFKYHSKIFQVELYTFDSSNSEEVFSTRASILQWTCRIKTATLPEMQTLMH